MTDDDALDRTSRELLGKLGHLREVESLKRRQPRSTSAFHNLSDAARVLGDDVHRLTEREWVEAATESPIPEERDEQRPGDWTDGE